MCGSSWEGWPAAARGGGGGLRRLTSNCCLHLLFRWDLVVNVAWRSEGVVGAIDGKWA